MWKGMISTVSLVFPVHFFLWVFVHHGDRVRELTFWKGGQRCPQQVWTSSWEVRKTFMLQQVLLFFFRLSFRQWPFAPYEASTRLCTLTVASWKLRRVTGGMKFRWWWTARKDVLSFLWMESRLVSDLCFLPLSMGSCLVHVVHIPWLLCL